MHRTIRFRVTSIAVLLSMLLLGASAVLAVSVLRRQLTDNLDEGLAQRADTIETVLAAQPNAEIATDEDLLVQAVRPDGTVVAASANLAGRPPIVSSQPGVRTVTDVPGRHEHFRVLVRTIDLAGSTAVLIVALNDDDVSDPVASMSTFLLVTVPVIVGVLGVLTWWLTGRTLRPVERLRREVSEITATNLGRRVAAPRTDDEIDRLARTMNATLDRLDSALQQQRRFVADASHELRSPLTRIRGELEVDLAAGTDADPVATERSVLAETVGLQHLVDDLLHLARSDHGIDLTPPVRVDLDDVVLREARRARERGRVAVDTRGVSAAQTLGDPAQLARVVRNLLDNAERHATSTVSVEVGEIGDAVVLTVADDGPGIAAELRDIVFERFTRLDDARSRDAGGTGLGLAIARDIVERHGGAIRIDEGLPTRFVVRLPLAP